jgi:hypothetical protein
VNGLVLRTDKDGAATLNSWFSHRANKRLLRETDGLPLGAGLSHEIYRGEGRGPDMEARIAGFQSKAVKQS